MFHIALRKLHENNITHSNMRWWQNASLKENCKSMTKDFDDTSVNCESHRKSWLIIATSHTSCLRFHSNIALSGAVLAPKQVNHVLPVWRSPSWSKSLSIGRRRLPSVTLLACHGVHKEPLSIGHILLAEGATTDEGPAMSKGGHCMNQLRFWVLVQITSWVPLICTPITCGQFSYDLLGLWLIWARLGVRRLLNFKLLNGHISKAISRDWLIALHLHPTIVIFYWCCWHRAHTLPLVIHWHLQWHWGEKTRPGHVWRELTAPDVSKHLLQHPEWCALQVTWVDLKCPLVNWWWPRTSRSSGEAPYLLSITNVVALHPCGVNPSKLKSGQCLKTPVSHFPISVEVTGLSDQSPIIVRAGSSDLSFRVQLLWKGWQNPCPMPWHQALWLVQSMAGVHQACYQWPSSCVSLSGAPRSQARMHHSLINNCIGNAAKVTKPRPGVYGKEKYSHCIPVHHCSPIIHHERLHELQRLNVQCGGLFPQGPGLLSWSDNSSDPGCLECSQVTLQAIHMVHELQDLIESLEGSVPSIWVAQVPYVGLDKFSRGWEWSTFCLFSSPFDIPWDLGETSCESGWWFSTKNLRDYLHPLFIGQVDNLKSKIECIIGWWRSRPPTSARECQADSSHSSGMLSWNWMQWHLQRKVGLLQITAVESVRVSLWNGAGST